MSGRVAEPPESSDGDRQTSSDLAGEVGQELREYFKQIFILTAAVVPGSLITATIWWLMKDQLSAPPGTGLAAGIAVGAVVAAVVIHLLGGFGRFFR